MNSPLEQTEDKARFLADYKAALLKFQEGLLELEQVEFPVTHTFCEGIYFRTIFMKKGTLVVGKTHKTRHMNHVITGSAEVMIGGEIRTIQAPYDFISEAGSKKILQIKEDMLWTTIHPTEETDIDKLDEIFVLTNEEEKALIESELEELNKLEVI
jgi:hypothetical protein